MDPLVWEFHWCSAKHWENSQMKNSTFVQRVFKINVYHLTLN